MKILVYSILILGLIFLVNACSRIQCDCVSQVIFSLDIVDEDGNRLVGNPVTDSTSVLSPTLIPIQHKGTEPDIWNVFEDEYSIFARPETIFVLQYDSMRHDTFKVDFLERSTNCCPKIKNLEIRRNGELICDPCEPYEEYRIVLK